MKKIFENIFHNKEKGVSSLLTFHRVRCLRLLGVLCVIYGSSEGGLEARTNPSPYASVQKHKAGRKALPAYRAKRAPSRKVGGRTLGRAPTALARSTRKTPLLQRGRGQRLSSLRAPKSPPRTEVRKSVFRSPAKKTFLVPPMSAAKGTARSAQPAANKKNNPAQPQRRAKVFLKIRSIKPAPLPPKQLGYLSLLNPDTQRNAKLGGLDRLHSQNLLGQGQMVALIEYSGTWEEMKKVINGTHGSLPNPIRETYKTNFLRPITGSNLDPDMTNDLIRSVDSYYHGSSVASLFMDFAPKAKVLPVSTYYCSQTRASYDLADALMDLSRRKEVSFVSVSSGHITYDYTPYIDEQNKTKPLKYKFSFPEKLARSFNEIAKAGKTIVIAAGNEGGETQIPEFLEKLELDNRTLINHLLKNVAPETRQSIIFAGNFDPNVQVAWRNSNKPGTLREAQETFLFAPGKHLFSYSGLESEGTSLSAPYISAALACLASKSPKITPRQAVKALLESADQKSDRRTYGRGLIRADKALELLERMN